jgi:hypothetical protein
MYIEYAASMAYLKGLPVIIALWGCSFQFGSPSAQTCPEDYPGIYLDSLRTFGEDQLYIYRITHDIGLHRIPVAHFMKIPNCPSHP